MAVSRLSPFQRVAIATTLLTYLLIAVGGLVRASGAGLGCPDWPRCFGSWIPPASAAELPPQFDVAQFNPTLMWTEYVNRLLGMLVGLAMLATAVSAWRHHRAEPRIVWAAVAAALLTGFQGWLGGRVVAHELAGWIVTAHMLVALVIVSLLLWVTIDSMVATRGSARPASPRHRAIGWWAWVVAGLLLVQVGIGSQVRSQVDEALTSVTRDDALATVGTLDMAHRNLAALLTLSVVALWAAAYTWHTRNRALVIAAGVAAICVIAQFAVGIVLASFALPPPAQVAHLTLATLLLGALTTMGLIAWRWPEPAA
jgi:cytochrome c oxidase assembly protein subunit 15